MIRRLVVRPQARQELAEASDWYDEHNERLGEELLVEFQVALEKILQNPFHYQRIGRRLRRVNLAKFPYGVLYSVTDHEVIVTSVFHGRRSPRRWQRQRH